MKSPFHLCETGSFVSFPLSFSKPSKNRKNGLHSFNQIIFGCLCNLQIAVLQFIRMKSCVTAETRGGFYIRTVAVQYLSEATSFKQQFLNGIANVPDKGVKNGAQSQISVPFLHIDQFHLLSATYTKILLGQ